MTVCAVRPKQLWTIRELARSLGLSPVYIRQIVQRHHIPYVPIGTAKVIDQCGKDRIQAILDSRTRRRPTAPIGGQAGPGDDQFMRTREHTKTEQTPQDYQFTIFA